MLIFKLKYLTWLILFLSAIAYYRSMSDLEINFFYKSMILMLPIQLISIIDITKKR